jgi:hypothetical protein
MTANILRAILALSFLFIFLDQKTSADDWGNSYDVNSSRSVHPAYVRVSYSSSDEGSQAEMQGAAAFSTAVYPENDSDRNRILRTRAPHRLGRLFVKPLHFKDSSSYPLGGHDDFGLQADDMQETSADKNEEGVIFLDPMGYTKNLLRTEDSYPLIAYIQ